jgi:hypothetical protein
MDNLERLTEEILMALGQPVIVDDEAMAMICDKAGQSHAVYWPIWILDVWAGALRKVFS